MGRERPLLAAAPPQPAARGVDPCPGGRALRPRPGVGRAARRPAGARHRLWRRHPQRVGGGARRGRARRRRGRAQHRRGAAARRAVRLDRALRVRLGRGTGRRRRALRRGAGHGGRRARRRPAPVHARLQRPGRAGRSALRRHAQPHAQVLRVRHRRRRVRHALAATRHAPVEALPDPARDRAHARRRRPGGHGAHRRAREPAHPRLLLHAVAVRELHAARPGERP